MDREAWRAALFACHNESGMTEQLNISNYENALECLDLIVEDEYYLMVNPLF